MAKRTVAAICREIQMVKAVVSDEAVKAKLIAELNAELAFISGVTPSGQMELPVTTEKAPKK